MSAWTRIKAKYGNRSSKCLSRHNHRSALEAVICDHCEARKQSGEFVSIETEKPILVCGEPGHACGRHSRVIWIVDFKATNALGGITYIEAKGVKTDSFKVKLRLYQHYWKDPLEIWSGSWQKPYLAQRIEGK